MVKTLPSCSTVLKLCLLAYFLALNLSCISAQAVIPLYLTNVTLDPYPARQGSNTAYFGVYQLGTPPKQFTGCFDTGSADAWVPLSTCLTEACRSHDTYTPNASSTYQGSEQQFSITYATGSVFGAVMQDTMTLGGITVPNQAFGAVNVAGPALLQSSCDGIFGLGFPRISQLKAVPPFFSMVNASLLAANVFSFWHSPDTRQEPAGEMVLGGVNAARLAAPATLMPVPNDTYWALPLGGAVVGGSSVQLGAVSAIIDTGSTAITIGTQDGAALHEQIPGAVYWDAMGLYNLSGGCSGISSLPTVSFNLAGFNYAVPPSLWVIKLMGTCVSGFIPSGRATQVVLGVTFLRAWHSQFIFDPATQAAQIGLARPAGGSIPQGASTAAASAVLTFNGRRLSAGNRSVDDWESRIFDASIPSAKDRGL